MNLVARALAFLPFIGTSILFGIASGQHLQAPGFYRGKLGTLEITAISDGTAPRHLDQIVNKPEIVVAEYSAIHEPQPVSLSINAYLVNTGSHLILIDTGAGELFGPGSGLLISNMKAAGYQPAQVDTILLTHIHADHSGGLSVGGAMQFANATVYVDQRDLEYFVQRKDRPEDSETLRRQTAQSRATLGPYLRANRIVPINPGSEIVPGIISRGQAGHTPGHTAYLVQSEGHRMLVWGDIIHSAEVQFAHPEVTIVYDTNPEEAAQARMRELDFVAQSGLLVASAHISFPGLGHVHKCGAAFGWAPIPYEATVAELDPK